MRPRPPRAKPQSASDPENKRNKPNLPQPPGAAAFFGPETALCRTAPHPRLRAAGDPHGGTPCPRCRRSPTEGPPCPRRRRSPTEQRHRRRRLPTGEPPALAVGGPHGGTPARRRRPPRRNARSPKADAHGGTPCPRRRRFPTEEAPPPSPKAVAHGGTHLPRRNPSPRCHPRPFASHVAAPRCRAVALRGSSPHRNPPFPQHPQISALRSGENHV